MAIEIGQSLAAGAIIDAERSTVRPEGCRGALNACRSALGKATAEIRNDEILLTRQARDLARQASLIGALEGALAAANSALAVSAGELRTSIVERPPEASSLESASHHPPRLIGAPANEQVVVEKLEVFPTVYTNVGSLLDVFA